MQRVQPANTATGAKKSKREKEFFDDFFTSAFSANQQSLGFLPTETPMSTVATVTIDNICDGNYTVLMLYREDLTLVVISYEIYETSLR